MRANAAIAHEAAPAAAAVARGIGRGGFATLQKESPWWLQIVTQEVWREISGLDRRAQGAAVERARTSMAAKGHGHIEIGEEIEDRIADAGFACDGEPEAVKSADQDGAGAEGEGFQDVRAAADAAIEQHGRARRNGFGHRGQGIE